MLASPLLVQVLEHFLASFALADFVLTCGAQKSTAARHFRTAFDAVFGELGFSCRDVDGVVPASLRAGGSTHLFRTTHDLSLVRWRGRWDEMRSLEHYVQELGAAEMLSTLDPATRARVRRLASCAPRVLRQYIGTE